MKKLLMILACCFAMVGCAPPADSGSEEDVDGGSNTTTAVQPTTEEAVATIDTSDESLKLVKIEVPGMTCAEGCPPVVKSALAECDGVDQVDVCFDSKTATIAIDEQNFDVTKAIAKLGEYGFKDSALKN
ncbi:MAG: cation transporter [Planctomycetota bacterium]